MSPTGAVTWLARITSRPVMHGIVLGLGLAFMLEGVRMMQGGLLLAVVALTFALLSAGRVPALLSSSRSALSSRSHASPPCSTSC